jgi:hypothetical protein
MANLSKALSDLRSQRKRMADDLEKLDQAIAVLGRLDSGGNGRGGRGVRTSGVKRRLSAAARRRIAEAQRLRWAKWKAKQQRKTA